MDQQLYQKALNIWGIELQQNVLIEECSELTKAIMKFRRSNCKENEFHLTCDIIEELVDVEIMLEQMKVYYKDFDHIYKGVKEHKLERLEERVKKLG